MPTPNLIHEKAFTVRYYEVGPTRLVRAATMLDYLQDAAAEHASALRIGVQDMHHRDLTWVLARLRLVLVRLPGVNEAMIVRTWPSTRSGFSSYREFEVRDAADAILARATTSWVVIDLTRRRPVRIDGVLPDYPLDGRRAVDDEFPPLPRPAGDGSGLVLTVRRADLDMNRHVNNAVYLGWALESLPEEVANGRNLVDVEIGFRAEALAGDVVRVRCAPEPDSGNGSWLHEIVREGDGKDLARMRSRWTPGGTPL